MINQLILTSPMIRAACGWLQFLSAHWFPEELQSLIQKEGFLMAWRFPPFHPVTVS